jgi:hypothetical protein
MMLVIALSMRLQIVANVSIWQLMSMAAQVGGRISEKRGGPSLMRIAGIHVEPDRVDLQFRRRGLRQDFALRPPGAGDADRSGRRER